MTTEKLITEELRRSIGVESPPLEVEIEKGAIRRFAEAIGDPNPLYTNEAYARKSHYGGTIAPPTFLRSVTPTIPDLSRFNLPVKRILDAGSDWEYFAPIYAGDKLRVTIKLANAAERTGSLGRMLFMSYEITYRKSSGEVAATQKVALIYY